MRLRSLLVVMAACAVFSGPRAAEWVEVDGPPALVFPRDHGAHPGHRTEWWYVTGLLDTDDGNRYGFQLTFFRQGMASGAAEAGSSALRARQIVAAHLAIADISKGQFHHAERLRRADGALAGYSVADLEVWLDDWQLRSGPGRQDLRCERATPLPVSVSTSSCSLRRSWCSTAMTDTRARAPRPAMPRSM